MSNDSKKSLLKQAGILAIAGVISRIIGFIYNIPLANIIGDEGNGYYGTAYQAYTIVLMISAFSIPSAISKIIAGKLALNEYKSAHRIFKCALYYVAIVGGIGSLLLFFGANLFADDAGSALVLRFFAPTVFLFGFLGVLRGYFQARRTMIPTSVSQLLEQILNAIISVGGAIVLTNVAGNADPSKRAVYGAVGSSLGTGSGVLTALIFMIIVYLSNKKSIHEKLESDKGVEMSNSDAFKLIITVVTPFILSTCIYNLSGFLNSTIFSRVLSGVRGMDHEGDFGIKFFYGIFIRKAMVITNIPIAFSAAAASAMIPEISTAFAKGDKKGAEETIAGVMRVMMMIAIPCAVGLFALANPVMWAMFPQKKSVDIATFYLALLAVTVIFYCVSTVSNAVLQGTGRLRAPVVNAAVALVVQSALLVGLLVFTDMTGEALCIVTIVYSLLMCVLNNISIRKYMDTKIDIKQTYVLPFIASAVMGVVAYGVYRGMFLLIAPATASVNIRIPYFTSLGVAIVIAIFVYFAVLIKIGGATREDIRKFPKGASLVRVLEKIRLL